jgi:Rps23 Pro-64 3,4-dihydroxylase Tpa1-like proline 4-hydroxylase
MIQWPADLRPLARAFEKARPFRHAVIDDLLTKSEHARVSQAFDSEPHVLVENEIYLHLRSSDPPMTPALNGLHRALQASCAQVSQICGRTLTRADGSAYVYLPGHYLLPHSDSRASEGRAVAYAYYAAAPKKGGELDLFERTFKRVAKSIAARPNRLVLFEVHDQALHQVREVLDGARTSMAGWFYP